MKKLLLGELLARVAEPESPEERDAAWDEVVARFDELVVVRERAERLERQVRKESVEGENAWGRVAELEARLGRAAAVVEAAGKYAHGRGSHQSLLDALAVLAEQEKQQP